MNDNYVKLKAPKVDYHRSPLYDAFQELVMKTINKEVTRQKPTGRMFGPRDKEHPF